MYLQIKKAKLTPDKFGSNITISMIGLYEDDGKWIKWIKLNDKVIEAMIDNKIPVKI